MPKTYTTYECIASCILANSYKSEVLRLARPDGTDRNRGRGDTHAPHLPALAHRPLVCRLALIGSCSPLDRVTLLWLLWLSCLLFSQLFCRPARQHLRTSFSAKCRTPTGSCLWSLRLKNKTTLMFTTI